MSYCTCDNPREYRATSENAEKEFLYLRCNHCGGKVGRVDIDLEALAEHITDPNDLDPTRPDVAESIDEHETATVSIHLSANDSPFMFHRDDD